MTRGDPDRVPTAAGLALISLGVVLGLDQLDLISLGINLAAAAICAAAGFVLVVAGLGPEDREHPDQRSSRG